MILKLEYRKEKKKIITVINAEAGWEGIVDGCWELLLLPPPPLPSANSLNLMNNAVRNTADKEMVVSLSLSHSLIHIWSICNHTRAHRRRRRRRRRFRCFVQCVQQHRKWMIATTAYWPPSQFSSLKRKFYRSAGAPVMQSNDEGFTVCFFYWWDVVYIP